MLRRQIFPAMAVLWVFMAIAPAGPAAAQSDGTFTIGTSDTGLLIWLAKANGYLDGSGIEIEPVSSGVEAARRVVDGSLTVGTSSEFAFVSRILEDPVICIYASLSATRTSRLVSRSDRVGPAPADLEGRRVAVTPNGIGQYFLSQFFLLTGVDEQAVEIVPGRPDEIVSMITEGSVDAAMTWEPYITQIKTELGALGQEYPDQLDQYYYFVLHGRCDVTDAVSAQIAVLLNAIWEADQFAREQPDEAKAVLSDFLSIPREEMDRLWPKHSLGLSLSQNLLIAMEAEAEWRVSVGASAGPVPNMLNHISTGPLRRVNPALVRIVE